MKKEFRKSMSKFLTIAFSLSLVFSSSSKVGAQTQENMALSTEQIASMQSQLKELASEDKRKIELHEEDPEEVIRIIVELDEKPAAERMPQGIEASTEIINEVKEAQKETKDEAEKLEGAEIRHSYGNLVNGFSMNVKRKEIEDLKELDGVKSVKEANRYEPQINYAKGLTQAFDAWTKYNIKGQGMLVSIIDTGIDNNHKDLKDPKDSSKLKLNKDKAEEIKNNNILKAGKGTKTYFSDKIPFGYNYADKNSNIIDERSDGGHGMHVAGIVGADGNEEEIKLGQAVQGVAPETQLLAMKAFSNGPGGKYAFSDDIVAAIEDSATLGADVINMSLGSVSGFQDDDDAEQRAIKNATEKGVMVVVSAGNSSYSTAPYRDKNMKDISTVGAPALAKDALMVANFQNQNVTSYATSFLDSNGKEFLKTAYSEHTFKFEDNKELSLVSCGVGKPEDFVGKELKDKVALIERGDLAFTEKIINAQKAGACGVVMFNTSAGGEALINMATEGSITIPAIFVGNKAGAEATKRLKNKEDVKFKFTGDTISGENPNSGDYDDSTSWGTAPNLDFKPQIAGPGGNIFSTVNNNRYETMSGTSMSAPHVSGGMALILESIKEYDKDLKGRELVDYAKNVAMNTSVVKNDKGGVPFSPRRQGAGLIQISDAIKNKVTATYNGVGSVALKEIQGKNISFNIDLNNHGDKDVTYSLDKIGGVLSQEDKDASGEMARDIILSKDDADITFDKKEVTVKAKGTEKVNVTINIGDNLSTERFLEGYLQLKSTDSDQPSLVVPYMGYYGDWAKERIINYGDWEESDSLMAQIDDASLTALMATYKGDKVNILGDNPEDFAISPNGDNYCEEVIPYLYFLRNAKKVVSEVEDENGNVVVKAGEMDDVRKQVYNNSNNSGKSPSLRNDLSWNGMVYNKSKGENEAVKEGIYKLSIKSYVDLDNKEPQKFEVPIKVDITAPEIKVISSEIEGEDLVIKWNAKDNLAGILNSAIFIGDDIKKDAKIIDEGKELYSVKLKAKEVKDKQVSIVVMDKAYNLASVNAVVEKIEESIIEFNNKDFAAGSMDASEKSLNKEGMLEISGKVSYPIKSFKIDDKDVQVNKDLTFNFLKDSKELKQGINYIHVYAKGMDGNIAKVKQEDGSAIPANNYATKIYFDSEDPIINLTSPFSDGKGNIFINSEELILKGIVSDSGMGYKFYINGEIEKQVQAEVNYGHEYTAYEFNKKVQVENGDIMTLKAVDLSGHTTILKYKVNIDKEKPIVTIEGVENGKIYNENIKPEIKMNKEGTIKSTLNGKEYNNEEISEEGKYELIVRAIDNSGNEVESIIKFSIDKTAPVIDVKGVEDGKTYNMSVMPKITSDDKDATIKYILDGKEYDGIEPIRSNGEHKLDIEAKDLAGNISKSSVKFEIGTIINKGDDQVLVIKDRLQYSDGNVVEFILKDISTISKEVFEAVKDEEKVMIFKLDSKDAKIKWQFDTKNTTSIDKDLDIGLNENSPNKDSISALDEKAQIISFKHNGKLPCLTKVTMVIDKEKINLTKNIYSYYFNETTNKPELHAENLKAFNKDNEDYIELNLEHCSDYFLSNLDSKTIIKPDVDKDKDKDKDKNKDIGGTNDNNTSKEKINSKSKLVKTGSMVNTSSMMSFGTLLCGLGYVMSKKGKKNK
ncbi:S8 family serine peptidase [Clostridium algidicarnis]|uniref:S8 family serine peptidase n=1 Tax=Clostridium algidicarnis TaxID=37659 RepID=UPI001CF2A8FE|nr:S8 family serine peptidase [Clostridium algidicarnis]MCB2285945.1 S8 family serine peptidase [Clostridium algidicarnis]